MYHPFSVIDILKTSWYLFKRNFVTIIVFSVISFILLSVLGIIIEVIIAPEAFAGKMVVSFFLILTQAYTTLGLYKLIFTLIDSEYYEFEFKQVLPGFKMMVSYLAVAFILAFGITNFAILVEYLDNYPLLDTTIQVVGVIGALYFFLRIMFFNTFIVDDHSGPIESLKQSFRLTKGYLLKVLVILGIIVLCIGLPAKISQYYPLVSIAIMFTYPFVNIILAVTYRKLVYSHQDVDDDLNETN
ncbi:MAG: hypothetical protein JO080_05210 [Mucilaginibacter sp.]|nr:hypothetical protein [Mucilaginibacter sp.]